MGSVDRKSTAEVLTAMIEQIDGVVAAEAQLAWGFDDTRPDVPDRDYVNLPWRQVR